MGGAVDVDVAGAGEVVGAVAVASYVTWTIML